MSILFHCKRAGLILGFAGLGFGVSALQAHADHRGRKYTPPPPTATINVTVLRGTNGKPIPNAAVIFHPYKNGKDSGALELKSNDDGKVKIDVIPVGDTVRLQVIATGWETFGNDYEVQTDSQDIVVKMKRPGPQNSSYSTGARGPTNDTSTTTPQGRSTSARPSDQTPLPQ